MEVQKEQIWKINCNQWHVVFRQAATNEASRIEYSDEFCKDIKGWIYRVLNKKFNSLSYISYAFW